MWQLSQFEQWQAVGDLQRQRTMFHLNEERHFQDEMETLLSVGQGNIESENWMYCI
jgi:CCR4-NOT transcriptional regulation complex NOT5 subunit